MIKKLYYFFYLTFFVLGFFVLSTPAIAEKCDCQYQVTGRRYVYDIATEKFSLHANANCSNRQNIVIDTDVDRNKTIQSLSGPGGKINLLRSMIFAGGRGNVLADSCLPFVTDPELVADGITPYTGPWPSPEFPGFNPDHPDVNIFPDSEYTCNAISDRFGVTYFPNIQFVGFFQGYFFPGYYDIILDCPENEEPNPPIDENIIDEISDDAVITKNLEADDGGVGKSKSLSIPFKLPESQSSCNHPLNPFGCVDIPTLIGRVINIGFSLLGTFALLWFVYAGIMWMFAAGNSERSGKALKMLTWGALGLLMIFASYAITSFVLEGFK